MSDNAGWLKKMLMWDWHEVCLNHYPGWELQEGREGKYPAFVKLSHVRRGDKFDVESRALCESWDDVAEVRFYQRDWTDGGSPYCCAGETYWSGWWFQTIAERDRFLVWLQSKRKFRKLYSGREA